MHPTTYCGDDGLLLQFGTGISKFGVIPVPLVADSTTLIAS